jgi:hypothetical protein
MRYLLESTKTVDEENNKIIWSMVFFNDKFDHMVERKIIVEPIKLIQESDKPLEESEESQSETEIDDVPIIPTEEDNAI